jgi:hypothetical protein
MFVHGMIKKPPHTYQPQVGQGMRQTPQDPYGRYWDKFIGSSGLASYEKIQNSILPHRGDGYFVFCYFNNTYIPYIYMV